MTLDEMDAAANRAATIRAALGRLKEAQERLELLRHHHAARKDHTIEWSWNPELILKKADERHWGSQTVKVRIQIPFGVVQQQLVYAVEAARREVVKLGGSLP